MQIDFNRTAPIRAGEELPVERLADWLSERLPELGATLAVEQFPAGHSNLTYLLRWGTTALVLRRPPFGNQVKSAHDVGREYRVLSQLWHVFAAAPRPFGYCDDDTVIGAPFYVMERRRGLVLRSACPTEWNIDPNLARQISTTLIDTLAALHTLDYRAAGLGDLGNPEGYVRRQVTGCINRYTQASTRELPEIERVARWLTENVPAESGASVIHNDFKYDNVMFDPGDPTRIVAVLDWEMTTVGDPLMDFGTSLAFWIEAGDAESLRRAAFGPTALAGSLTRRELVERYQQQTGREVTHPLFYYCYGLYKIAMLLQQIFARYARGHTKDGRFARLEQVVVDVARQADRALESGSL